MSEQSGTTSDLIPPCPRCGGDMWDNREGKRNPRAPDFKCKDRSCDGVIWPPKGAAAPPGAAAPRAAGVRSDASGGTASTAPVKNATGGKGPSVDDNGMPLCPVCGGAMWDDRLSKRNPRAPDFKCRNKPKERGGPGCEGVIWPARDGSPSPYPPPVPRRNAGGGESPAGAPGHGAPPRDDAPPHEDDDLPF